MVGRMPPMVEAGDAESTVRICSGQNLILALRRHPDGDWEYLVESPSLFIANARTFPLSASGWEAAWKTFCQGDPVAAYTYFPLAEPERSRLSSGGVEGDNLVTGGPTDEGGRCPVGHAGAPGSRFCGECGAPLTWPRNEKGATAEGGGAGPAPRLCPQGHPAEPEDAFCTVCGGPLDPHDGVAEGSAGPRQRSTSYHDTASNLNYDVLWDSAMPIRPDRTEIFSRGGPFPTRDRWRVGRKILVGVVGIVLIAAAVAIPLALRSSRGGSTAPAPFSSEGYSFINPHNGDQGADPLFVNAQPTDYDLCAQAYQEAIDMNVINRTTVNYQQMDRDSTQLDATLLNDSSSTAGELKQAWIAVGGPDGGAVTNSDITYWDASVEMYCTGPAAFSPG